MENKWYVAIDVSKKWLDACLFVEKAEIREFPHVQVENSKEGIKNLMSWLRKLGVVLRETSFMWEHTGGYGWLLRDVMHAKKYKFRIENPLEIKHRTGYSNDKSDHLDAARMADFLARYADRLKPSRMPSKKLLELEGLRNERKFYVKQRAALQNRKQTDFSKGEVRRHMTLIKTYDEMIDRLEKKMNDIICSDDELFRTYDLLRSCPGIGNINAINFICITENGTSFENARQYASYIGVAPHSKNSGKSVHWKAKPSLCCDGQAKADLGMGARIVVEHDAEFAAFYKRKIQNNVNDKDIRRKVYNAIKFKMVLRMFSVVRRGYKYYSKAGVPNTMLTNQENYDEDLPRSSEDQS